MTVLIASAAALLLASGLAIAYVIGGIAVLAFVATDNTRYLAILPQKIFSQMDVFALMAMPLFILAGEIMNRAGVTRALIGLALAVVGPVRGGLGHVNILTSVFFAGISGSAVADAAALSNTLAPTMRERGYAADYAAAITAASAVIGPLVPPSIILIFYGALMQTSVVALFAAGILPGLLLAVMLMAANAVFAMRDGHPRGDARPIALRLRTAIAGLPALSLPVIILGGMVFGWMTPTEGAAVAVIAAVGVGLGYDGLSRATMIEALQRTAILTGSIFVILAAAAAIGHLVALERLPQAVVGGIDRLGLGPLGYLLLLNVILLLAGMVLDVAVALALLAPLLAPVALALGVDPVHLGIVFCFNLCIGLITPPLGACLLVVASVTGTPYWTIARAILPFIAVEIAVLVLIILYPPLALALPRALGLMS